MSNAAKLLERWYQEVWADGNEQTIRDLWGEGLVLHGVGPEPVRSPAEFVEFWAGCRASLPDLRIEVHEIIGDGDTAALRATSYFTDPRTGASIAMNGSTFAVVKDGKFSRVHDTWDFLAPLEATNLVDPGAVQKMMMTMANS